MEPADVLHSGQRDDGASPSLVFNLEGHHHSVAVLPLPQRDWSGNRVTGRRLLVAVAEDKVVSFAAGIVVNGYKRDTVCQGLCARLVVHDLDAEQPAAVAVGE